MAGLDDLRRVAGGFDAGDGESERRGGDYPVINPILRPFADVSADRDRRCAGVADRGFDYPPGRDDRCRNLGGSEDLSRRRANVRQTAHTAGTDQVVEVQLKRERECGLIELSISISRPRLNKLIIPHSAFRIPHSALPLPFCQIGIGNWSRQ
jgi:hypothetical protein